MNPDLSEQGIIQTHLCLWPRELCIDRSIYLCSLITELVIVALAECVYQKLPSRFVPRLCS